MIESFDKNELFVIREDSKLMDLLLKDQTTQKNIFWATDSYASRGEGYQFEDIITVDRIIGENEGVLRPRCFKNKEVQAQRTRDKAEVFTPSWICNKQNNLVDNAWFGRTNVFNIEHDDYPQKIHSWTPSSSPIEFPDGKNWKDYVNTTRLEITCGEAPYLVSRYDTLTGEFIPMNRRIGLLDRKLRVVNENTTSKDEWLKMAILSYQSILGYEWQGDNVLLARESLLMAFIEYYKERFNEVPSHEVLEKIAYIISWNIWQMDGLKLVVPMSCHEVEDLQTFLFEEAPAKPKPCPGCKNNDIHRHNGIYCNVMDWETEHPVKFYTLLKNKK